ncbi:MAG: cell division ATP-binding protein FtsE [Deltaproteobacteria bacterium]|nr:cell division ATP-binding protein FtsE [Deltaproteobacteria bacterium]
MIQLYNVSKKFGANMALRDIDLKIGKGEFVYVTGPSGAGKTTLLRLIFGSEKPDSGDMLINAINLKRIGRSKLDHLRRRIGFVFQDFKLLPTKTVFENVSIALEVMGQRAKVIRKRTHQALRMVGLSEKEMSYPLSLSGGEQQRVAIARAIVKSPMILLADEPTGNLDPELTREIVTLFLKIHERGTTVILATHSRALLEAVPCRTIQLKQGRVIEDRCY